MNSSIKEATNSMESLRIENCGQGFKLCLSTVYTCVVGHAKLLMHNCHRRSLADSSAKILKDELEAVNMKYGHATTTKLFKKKSVEKIAFKKKCPNSRELITIALKFDAHSLGLEGVFDILIELHNVHEERFRLHTVLPRAEIHVTDPKSTSADRLTSILKVEVDIFLAVLFRVIDASRAEPFLPMLYKRISETLKALGDEKSTQVEQAASSQPQQQRIPSPKITSLSSRSRPAKRVVSGKKVVPELPRRVGACENRSKKQ